MLEAISMVGNARMIHVVDDDKAVRESLQVLLESYDYPVRTYGSPAEFLLAGNGHSGCLVADLNMPGMNGLELMAAVRQEGGTIPVIVITGRGDPALREHAVKAGAFALLDKPVDGTALRGTIEEALASGGAC
jgi:two-component system response regulator FixJ